MDTYIDAIADVAADWHDPDFPARAEAVEHTLAAPNRWTEQALAHALNQWMHCLTPDQLSDWIGENAVTEPQTVGVLHGEAGPLDGFRDALAVWALGHNYVGLVPESSPALLPAFADDLRKQAAGIQIEFASEEQFYERADAILASAGETSVDAIHEVCEAHGIPEERRQVRLPLYSIGILDGNESEDEMERLAEDMLLFEGEGRRRVAILWAPRDHSPDAYLEAMAHFRGVYPAHPDTPGTLQMQQAFLEARDEPHAYAEGLEFLLSRGAPEPQRAGHVRWSEYDDLNDVEEWLAEHEEDVYAVVARRHFPNQVPEAGQARTPGGLHVPPLDDPSARTLVEFLRKRV